jgi:hypothetical protein
MSRMAACHIYICVQQRKIKAGQLKLIVIFLYVTAKALKIIVLHTEMLIIVMQAFVAVCLQWSAHFKLGFKMQLMSNV